LIKALSRKGLVEENSTLDDVLNLQVSDMLSRRLQTVVQKKLHFRTPYQARQAVVHGHIMINDRVVTVPSYTIKVEEEQKIQLVPKSHFNELLSQPEEPEPEKPEVEETSAKQS